MLKSFKVASAIFVFALPAGAITTYGGYDIGAGSLATAPNATAAAAAFDAAAPGLSVIDFESVTAGFSFSPDAVVTNSGICVASLCGYNTTSGGSNFLFATYQTTLSFATGIDAFGAYFTGVQRDDASLTFSDGSVQTLILPAAILASGGTYFFGFIDPGKSITSITYFTGTGGDYVGVDDIRYGTVGGVAPVPLPATLPLLLAGVFGLGAARRRRNRAA